MKRANIFLLMMIMCLIPMQVVQADTGPKPSISVTVENAPAGNYYVDLLQKNEYDPDREFDEDEEEPAAVYTKALKQYHEDGWCARIDWGICDAFYHPRNDSKTYEFGYIVPDEFKVILVTESGDVYTSPSIKRQSFHAEMVYDVKAGTLVDSNRKTKIEKVFEVVRNLGITLGMTLLIEGAILYLFGLWTRKNIVKFLCINVITQMALYFCLSLEMINTFVYLFYIAIEIFIMLIEALFFEMVLRNKENEHCRMRGFCYGIVANLASFILGIVILWNWK